MKNKVSLSLLLYYSSPKHLPVSLEPDEIIPWPILWLETLVVIGDLLGG